MSIPYSNFYPSLYRGVVEDNIDPMNLGRCKVRVPSVHGELLYPVDTLPWARPVVLTPTRKNRGSVNIPDVGDIVWILFEGSDKQFPIYFGGTYASGELPIDPNRVDLYTENDNNISYDRASNTYSINIGNNSIKIDPEGVTIEEVPMNSARTYARGTSTKTNSIRVSSSGVTISGDVTVNGNLKLKTKKVLLIAGHGDGDPGAVGNGYKEADLTRELAALIKHDNDWLHYIYGNQVEITIADPQYNWYEYLKNHTFDFTGYDYVLELHFNSSTDPSAEGVEVCIRSEEKERNLPDTIMKRISRSLGFRYRGFITRDDLSVIRKINAQGVHCSLLEVCFISNPKEMNIYQNQKKYIASIIVDCFKQVASIG